MASSDSERAFPFLRVNDRPPKPRRTGVTEIRGPYYTPMGPHYLEDVLDTMGAYVDSLKFAGGSFSLMPRAAVKNIIDICHRHDVSVSTGGFMEYVLRQSPAPFATTSASAATWASTSWKFPAASSPFRWRIGCAWWSASSRLA